MVLIKLAGGCFPERFKPFQVALVKLVVYPNPELIKFNDRLFSSLAGKKVNLGTRIQVRHKAAQELNLELNLESLIYLR